MKVWSVFTLLLSVTNGFSPDKHGRASHAVTPVATGAAVGRMDFLKSVSVVSIGLLGFQEPVFATGRATLEQSYDRYTPRIRAGGEFYQGDFKQMVASGDWAGIKAATGGVPPRQKEDLQSADAGVAARARQAGAFSEDRVLVAADLFASAFSSQNSITTKTKKMKASVETLRETVNEMQLVARQGLGEDTGGGFFGLGAKKPSEGELRKRIRDLYVAGGNAWNEYVFVANDSLALQFDRLAFVK